MTAVAPLLHGFHIAFYVLAALALLGAILAALMVESKPKTETQVGDDVAAVMEPAICEPTTDSTRAIRRSV